MSERSTLSLRVRPHFHPDRQEDIVVEVLRAGEVVATIYGSREGVHIVGERVCYNRPPFGMMVPVADDAPMPSCVVPLLREGEACPWCEEGGKEAFGLQVCPVCGAKK
jgi:hypothetical protein